MYSDDMLLDRLHEIQEALNRIPERFHDISSFSDFYASASGREHLDAICMVLLAVGEAIRQIDDKTSGQFLSQYSEIPWREIKGIRHVLAHGYFDIDAEQIFSICQNDLNDLMKTIERMINDLEKP